MKVKLTSDQTGTGGPLPAGTEIEHPDAFRLLQLGIAEPVDEEARNAMAEYEATRKANAERSAQIRADLAARKKAARVDDFARKLGVEPENRKLKTK